MSRIDVAFGAEHRIQQASQTVYKHFLAGRCILVYCTDQARLAAFSQALWAVDKAAFVPHPYWDTVVAKERKLPQAQVFLCSHINEEVLAAKESLLTAPWLLNLDIHCPPMCEQFDRILEIVSHHPLDKDLARERILFYKRAGHQVIYHDLSRII